MADEKDKKVKAKEYTLLELKPTCMTLAYYVHVLRKMRIPRINKRQRSVHTCRCCQP